MRTGTVAETAGSKTNPMNTRKSGKTVEKNMIFDTHAHYDDEKFEPDREKILASLYAAGIDRVVNIGANMATSRSTLALVEKHDFMRAAVGVHPEDIAELVPYADGTRGNAEEAARNFTELQEAAKNEKVVMIGEIGLDYYWDKDHHAEQIEGFRKQIRLALELGLPICVHSRDAAEDTYNVLKDEYDRAKADGKRLRAIIHCFAYSREMADRFLAMGFLLGVGGVVTFKNSKKLKEVVREVPLESLVLETDCPYLAPEPHRGERNSSAFLPLVADEIAKIKEISADEVIGVTRKNAERFLFDGE